MFSLPSSPPCHSSPCTQRRFTEAIACLRPQQWSSSPPHFPPSLHSPPLPPLPHLPPLPPTPLCSQRRFNEAITCLRPQQRFSQLLHKMQILGCGPRPGGAGGAGGEGEAGGAAGVEGAGGAGKVGQAGESKGGPGQGEARQGGVGEEGSRSEGSELARAGSKSEIGRDGGPHSVFHFPTSSPSHSPSHSPSNSPSHSPSHARSPSRPRASSVEVPREGEVMVPAAVPAAAAARSPVLLLIGGGAGAGKSTVVKEIMKRTFWARMAPHAVVVEAIRTPLSTFSLDGCLEEKGRNLPRALSSASLFSFLLPPPFWARMAPHAVVVDSDAFKEKDAIFRALSADRLNDAARISQLVHEESTRAAQSTLVTALNNGRDVIFDGTKSWAPFVQQTIAMARQVHERRFRMGPGYQVREDGSVVERYWEEVDEEGESDRGVEEGRERWEEEGRAIEGGEGVGSERGDGEEERRRDKPGKEGQHRPKRHNSPRRVLGSSRGSYCSSETGQGKGGMEGARQGGGMCWERRGQRGGSEQRLPYRIELVGVMCDAHLAVARGMRRAILSRRGVPVHKQLQSHRRFASSVEAYCDLVDVATLYCTDHTGGPPQKKPVVAAWMVVVPVGLGKLGSAGRRGKVWAGEHVEGGGTGGGAGGAAGSTEEGVY
ncbi:unnamed protein product [Closterium sp. NIES-64]|nr:unnamed protein product [Closterium sp. NIES-64]